MATQLLFGSSRLASGSSTGRTFACTYSHGQLATCACVSGQPWPDKVDTFLWYQNCTLSGGNFFSSSRSVRSAMPPENLHASRNSSTSARELKCGTTLAGCAHQPADTTDGCSADVTSVRGLQLYCVLRMCCTVCATPCYMRAP